MIDIKILFILPESLDKEILVLEEIFGKYELTFKSISDRSLESEIKNSDIQIIVIENEIGYLTKDMYENIDKNYIQIYINDELKLNINNITKSKMKLYSLLHNIKESSIKYNSSESNEILVENIKKYLDKKIVELEDKRNRTYLEAIKIEDYFSIKEEMIIPDLKDKKEIYFVGENGDGKTVLLQAILLALKGDEYSDLAERYIKNVKSTMKLSTKDTQDNDEYKSYKNIKNIFAYGINRNKISNLESKTNLGYSALFDTPHISGTTYLREPQDLLIQDLDIVTEFKKQIKDLMGGKLDIYTVVDEVKFKEIDGDDDIDFDMLSEGYKSTLIWLCDLLSRLMENQKDIKKLDKYQAIVLVDEIDLYLHPKWRYNFVYKIRQIFPKIQFIMTTHSIVSVLGASNDDETAFYKIYKENGNTKVTEQINNIKHYTANILITSPLFNLDNVKARNYDEDERVSSDDYVYNRIHKKIKERIDATNTVNTQEIDDWLEEEFNKEFKD